LLLGFGAPAADGGGCRLVAAGPNGSVERLGDVQLDAEAIVVLAARFGSQARASALAGKSLCHAPGGPPLAY
jgi:hypothetical protein